MRVSIAAAILLAIAAAPAAGQTANPADDGVIDLDQALAESAAQPQAPQASQAQQQQVVGESPPAQRLGAIAVEALEGSRVVTPAGEKLGEIEKVVIDPGYGRITYALIEVGGFLGVGEREVAVPWAALRLGQEDDTFVLDSTRDQLANAPAIDEDKIGRITDLDVARSVHAYYGLRPYWMDAGVPQQAEASPR